MYHCANHPPFNVPIMKHNFKRWLVKKCENISLEWVKRIIFWSIVFVLTKAEVECDSCKKRIKLDLKKNFDQQFKESGWLVVGWFTHYCSIECKENPKINKQGLLRVYVSGKKKA